MISISVISLIILSIKLVASGRCPPEIDIEPCTCTNVTINCIHSNNFNLEAVFKSIATVQVNQVFETFLLNSTGITKLSQRLFSGIKFETLSFVNCHQLVCVSPLAFAGLESTTTTFQSVGTSFGKQTDDCNVFKALNSLTNLQKIHITGSDIYEIPEIKGIGNTMTKLVNIDLSGESGHRGSITTIDKNAFSELKALQYLSLANNNISTVSSFAFEFLIPSNKKLIIDLTHNNLNPNSFGSNAFEVNERITTIKLGANKMLTVLDEAVFRPFLNNKFNESDNNIIDMTGTELVCTSKNVWLLESDATLHLRHKITNLLDTNGQNFWFHSIEDCNKFMKTD